MNKVRIVFLGLLIFLSCNDTQQSSKSDKSQGKIVSDTLFKSHNYTKTGLKFMNTVNETMQNNYLSYEFLYNGSGVAIGDINNDGLDDIYFAGNSSNDQLYINEGNLSFKDISASSGIATSQGWSTGVTLIDINSDGWLDIYVCRSGPSKDDVERTNKLYINNKDTTFSEKAKEYGLANQAYSIQSAFFDYDLDGDLDMYLLNHPAPSFSAKKLKLHMKDIASGAIKTDNFYENVNGKFVDKTVESGLSNFGFRHGIAIGDVNKDGYPDIFISSDFEEPDVLEINQRNGTFENKVESYFQHISMNSMGNELVDINNDGMLDLFVVDMAPDDHFRSKAYMKSMDMDKFNALKNNGYHYQYMFNTLQLNKGNNNFSEIAQFSGIAKSDWSWSPLFFDMDLDGDKDLFITNGIKENFLFRDIQKEVEKRNKAGNQITLENLLQIVPSDISENMFYENNSDLTFKKVSGEWALPSLHNSNGVATADLDNDGDLDFVTNNMDSYATLYESKAIQQGKKSLKLVLEGSKLNPLAIGAKITITTTKGEQYQELYNSRGYLSSVAYPIIFGLGDATTADVRITWPDGLVTKLKDVASNIQHTIRYTDATKQVQTKTSKVNPILTKSLTNGISFKHEEDEFNDYAKQILLPHSQSNTGPSLTKGDVNNDGLEDIYIGGASGQAGQLFIQKANGSFIKKSTPWNIDAAHEDTGAVFFDSDADGDLDLYIVSGGAHLPEGNAMYADRFYKNDGKGNYTKSKNIIPNLTISGKVVIAADIDGDKDIDLFIGGRIIPDRYPYAPKSYLLINEGGTFTEREIPVNSLVSSALFSDYDNDGDKDLFIVGEWSPLKIFNNENGRFKSKEVASFEDTTGLWFVLAERDIDGDGDMDYFAGNIGLNTKYKITGDSEFHIYSYDFDNSGSTDVVLSTSYKGNLVPARGRECSSQQMPFIQDKFTDYRSFAGATLQDIYGDDLNNALHYQAQVLASVFIENKGNGNFEIIELPSESQFSPLSGFEFYDIDNDGQEEIITVGNLYNVEVETQRYDASKGNILGYKEGAFKSMEAKITGFVTTGDAREVITINSKNKTLLLVTNNNGPLDIFTKNHD